MILRTLFFSVLLSFSLPSIAVEGTLSVLHWWTSPSETKAATALKQSFTKLGYEWIDQSIAGGSGIKAMTVLKSQVISGNPPSSAQINGLGIQDWASLDLLSPNNTQQQKWDKLLPKFVSEAMKYRDQYYGIPINIHRNNWLWVNPKAFTASGLSVPSSWNDLIAMAPQLRRAGFIPLSHGGEAWQQAAIFESVLLAEGGADFYRSTLVDRNSKALQSDTMINVFKKLRQVTTLMDTRQPSHSWDQATQNVINNEAAIILMGDWALGEFALNNKKEGHDYLCMPVFGTKGSYIYNIDSFVMFNTSRSKTRRAQHELANLLMDKDMQKTFSQHKGSIPARIDAGEQLSGCQKRSWEDLQTSIDSNTLVPSIIHGMATRNPAKTSLIYVISRFINDPSISSKEAVTLLSTAIQSTP